MLAVVAELREFGKDNSLQLKGSGDKINKTNIRTGEAEERIKASETQIQTTKEGATEQLKLQILLPSKLRDLVIFTFVCMCKLYKQDTSCK